MSIEIRGFVEQDAGAVRALFIAVNRLLAPPDLRAVFDAYIEGSLAEEIDRIQAYYSEHGGGFWVAVRDKELVGMFGLEMASVDTLELRRMYVAPSTRRVGIASLMLQYAEAECRRRGMARITLSTSELQSAAVALYQSAGYRLVAEATAEQATNKTIGGRIRRYYFEKTMHEPS